MPVRRLARFHKRNPAQGGSSALHRGLSKVALRLLDLVAISVTLVLVAMPFVWRNRRAEAFVDSWSASRFSEMGAVEKDWMTLAPVPPFHRGDEPGLRDYLQANPLVSALQARTGPRQIWVRQGDSLVPGLATPDGETYRGWFNSAEQAQCFIYHPETALTGEARSGPKIVLLGDRWLVAKCWREGSPEVERYLRKMLYGAHPWRLVLMREGGETAQSLEPQAWGAEPNLQADPYRGRAPLFSSQLVSNEFPGWNLTLIPFRTDALAFQRYLRLQFALAAGLSALIGGSLLLALHLRTRARRKAALDSDRMASMTHSLKTPLAILKFRCDSLRLGRLDPDQLDGQLIQIGEEADRLSNIIEHALMAIQGQLPAGPQNRVTPEWIASIKEDLAPAFEVADRSLQVSCADHEGLAALPTLRAALFTLVENALFHGEGTTTLETSRVRDRLLIRVSDEGPGVGSMEMKSLGRPFMRIRSAGKEGFAKDGLGLGLSLLTKVAEREGWGLTFSSEAGKGLCVTLEIQAV